MPNSDFVYTTTPSEEPNVPFYWYNFKDHYGKNTVLKVHISFNAVMMMPTFGDFFEYDSKLIDTKSLPKMEMPNGRGVYPVLSIIDAIGKRLFIDDKLNVYEAESKDMYLMKGVKFVLKPILCKNSHKPKHMIALDGMVICEICGRTLADKEMNKYD